MPAPQDLPISGLELATPTALDFLEILDVSDVSMGPFGSNKKTLVSSLLALVPAPDLSAYMLKSANLSDVASAATARTNLGGTTVGAGLFTAASEAAARALINAARTDGANTFSGTQTLGDAYQWAWGDVGLARDSAGVLRMSDGSTGLGSLITSAITVGASGTTTGIDSTGSLNLRGGIYHSVQSTAFFFGNATNLIWNTTNYAWRNQSSSGTLMTLSAAAGLAVNSLGSTVVPVTINLASGQTAAALSILNSLGASLASINYSGDGTFKTITVNRSAGAIVIFDGAYGQFINTTGNLLFDNPIAASTYFRVGTGYSAALQLSYPTSGFTARFLSGAAGDIGVITQGATSQTAPLNAWQLVSSTGETQVAADTYSWTNSTHATRTPRIVRSITDYGAEREYMRVEGNGSAACIGFFGATAVAKPTGVPVTAADIHAALVSLGLIAA